MPSFSAVPPARPRPWLFLGLLRLSSGLTASWVERSRRPRSSSIARESASSAFISSRVWWAGGAQTPTAPIRTGGGCAACAEAGACGRCDSGRRRCCCRQRAAVAGMSGVSAGVAMGRRWRRRDDATGRRRRGRQRRRYDRSKGEAVAAGKVAARPEQANLVPRREPRQAVEGRRGGCRRWNEVAWRRWRCDLSRGRPESLLASWQSIRSPPPLKV